MALYPTLANAPYKALAQTIDQKVISSNFEELGKVQKKLKWLFPKRDVVSLEYKNNINSVLRILEQFFIDRNGSFGMFTFLMPDTEINNYAGEYFATGDVAGTVAFNLPTKAASGINIYIDGALQTVTVNYTIMPSGGADGVDLCTFTVAPNPGTRLTTDFSGILAIRCRFKDKINWSRIRSTTSYNSFNIELNGNLFDE
jgi:hypothetical protein